MTRHTQDEIVARIRNIEKHDFFGVQSEDLIRALDVAHAQEFLKKEYLDAWKASADEEILSYAREYLKFAVDKAVEHRGLSAGRSVDHYRAWVWLLEPERYEEFEAVPYPNYGAPQLKAAATILGFTDEWDRLAALNPEIVNMAAGKPCEPDCVEGCA